MESSARMTLLTLLSGDYKVYLGIATLSEAIIR